MRTVQEILAAEEFQGEWDSLTKLKAVVMVEQELGIQFKTEELANMNSIVDMRARVEVQVFNTQPIVKCIVCDLDGVMWDGILGEDGYGGVKITAAHQSLMTVLLDFKKRGVMLAICSKNELQDVSGVFSKRPEVLLALDDFCSVALGWNSKAKLILSIADELHIGLDTICFIDDSPQERAEVKSILPDVMVPDLGPDPRNYSIVVEGLEIGLDVTSTEDSRRTELIHQDQMRVAADYGVSRETYLHGLEQVVTVEELSEANVDRAVQLTQRANQFHLDLKRWDREELMKLDKCFVYSLVDRFGDAGRIGVAGIKGRTQIEVLVVSCRALGRGVEHAIIHHIVGECNGIGRALWMPGLRNAQVLDAMRVVGAKTTWVDEFGPCEAVFKEWKEVPWVKVIE